jgi:MFS superfamily sulfate permease-like transporter
VQRSQEREDHEVTASSYAESARRHPYVAVLGHIDEVKGYHDTERHSDARQVPGLVLYRFDAPLFFANADTFRQSLIRAVRDADPPTRFVVVAAEPITDVDSTAADVLVRA